MSCLPLARDALRVTARRLPFGRRFARGVYRHACRDTFGDFQRGSLPENVYREAVLRSSLRNGLTSLAGIAILVVTAVATAATVVLMPHDQGVWGTLLSITLVYFAVIGPFLAVAWVAYARVVAGWAPIMVCFHLFRCLSEIDRMRRWESRARRGSFADVKEYLRCRKLFRSRISGHARFITIELGYLQRCGRPKTERPTASAVERRLAWLLVDFDDPIRREHAVQVLEATLCQVAGTRFWRPATLPRLPFGHLPDKPLSATPWVRFRSWQGSPFLLALLPLAAAIVTFVAKVL
ncbi:hypothetical protein SAMN04489727_7657 [Amycolatopsis tolypomycina]|uniref:Uncharacterized protein n=1 Tax=Amycolatopsis tolypomycina TaxID=208445 RepID=A0A1H5A877_9PSEU|nr:hypothetical protein [Amycolatopsis tolypomycina]SED38593.1 hypothetical protein SAMN04489727_7657 [Amycolatopsis tolypomycina]